MSHYVTDLDGERKPRKLPDRELDATEVRILGSLAEKQMATPEYYPLTLNALVAACNQKSNREPVMELTEGEVQSALDRLQSEKLVWKVMGGRAVRWEHNLDATLQIDRPSKAVLALLLLRGAQTPGELRGRTERMYRFEALDDVQSTLQRLMDRQPPLVRVLPRQPGTKESRYMHLLAGDTAPLPEPEIAPASNSHRDRIAGIEAELVSLRQEVELLRRKLTDFTEQFK